MESLARLIFCRRRDTVSLFSSVVSYGILGLIYAIYGVLCRRYDARRLFTSVVSYGFPWIQTLFGILCGRRYNSLCGARLWFASAVACHPEVHLCYGLYGIFNRRRDDSRRDGLASVCQRPI
jgi:hypothetical protein